MKSAMVHCEPPPVCAAKQNDELNSVYSEDLSNKRDLIKFVSTPWKVEKTIAHGICGLHPDKVKWSMVIVVKSSASHFDRRTTIRETWGGIRAIDDVIIELVFIVDVTMDDIINKQTEEEGFLHGDVLLMPYIETSTPITLKTVAGMQWVAHILPDRWFYSSCDDDVAIHIPHMVAHLHTMLPHYRVGERNDKFDSFGDLPISCMYSYQKCDVPSRQYSSKWKISYTKYPPTQWPVYCRGGLYTTTSKMAAKLFEVSRVTELMHLDDVWVTGLLRGKLKKGNANIAPAPLSERSETELVKNADEPGMIVKHMWGDIPGSDTDVLAGMNEAWKSWKVDLDAHDVCAPNS
ncbi:beta-1,3-galactosyltransferase 5-like [Ciona intestinalis]